MLDRLEAESAPQDSYRPLRSEAHPRHGQGLDPPAREAQPPGATADAASTGELLRGAADLGTGDIIGGGSRRPSTRI